ncbi:MAG: hypothetical protein R6X15_08630 [Pseudomonadota bacterium]
MKSLHLKWSVLLAAALLLSACFAPKTPQEVTQSFWRAVISDDVGEAVSHSTLTDARDYDAFSLDWSGFQPTWGRVIIEGDEARIESEFSKGEGQTVETREFITYLVRRNDVWKVDYLRTAESLRAGPLERLFGQLGELGESLSRQFGNTSQEINEEMMRLGDRLKQQSESLSREMSEGIERYSEELRRSLEELAESVERALEERERSLSESDKRTLKEVASDLNEGSENLEKPSIDSLVESSQSATSARLRLSTLDDEAVGRYRQQWREWQEEFEAELEAMFAALSAMADEQR